MRLAVAGGTGTAGARVVAAARAAGHEAMVLSRRCGVDVEAGTGLAAALDRVDVVVDALNVTTLSGRRATAFFTAAAGHLQRAGAGAGVRRLVVLSIVGVDRLPGVGYYRAKLAHEAAAIAGPVPVTVLRATQFHEFGRQTLARFGRGPLALVPSARLQPVAADQVAAVAVELVGDPAPPARREVAGPEEINLVDLVRRTAAHDGRRVAVIGLPVPGPTGRALREGALLPGPTATVAGPGPLEWLGRADRA